MREFNSIVDDMVKYLEKRGQNDDDDYRARRAHYDRFQALWQDLDYEGVLNHINAGIKQFEKKDNIFSHINNSKTIN